MTKAHPFPSLPALPYWEVLPNFTSPAEPPTYDNPPTALPSKNQKREALPVFSHPSSLSLQPGLGPWTSDLRPRTLDSDRLHFLPPSTTSLCEALPKFATACAPATSIIPPCHFPPKNQKREALPP